jgi:hypothetical protein
MTQPTPQANAGPVFVTLGPAGTNHELVTNDYLAFRGLGAASVLLVDDFEDALAMMVDGRADFMVQVAVHPDCSKVVASAHFNHGIHIIDTFISPSKALGILTRSDVEQPKTLAIQAATTGYTNIDAWEELVHVSSIMRIAEGLLDGQYDSGLTTLELASEHPGRFRVDVEIGTVDDPWLVFGKRSVCNGELVAWPASPGAQQFST